MPNVYVHPNGGHPKTWARNANGDCIWGRLSGGRQNGHTNVTERRKESEGYVFVEAASWEAIEAALMGGVAAISSSTAWTETAHLVSTLRRLYGTSDIRVYSPPGPPPHSEQKTVGDAIAEWAKAKPAGANPEAAAWSW